MRSKADETFVIVDSLLFLCVWFALETKVELTTTN